MKIKRFQFWRTCNISYRKGEPFKFLSTKVKGEGDKTLENDHSLKNRIKFIFRKWEKVIILEPSGNPKTTFSMGFIPSSGSAKVSSATRRVEEGPFGMRMGPEDCRFFIGSNKGTVGLEVIGYTTIDDETKSELVLY